MLAQQRSRFVPDRLGVRSLKQPKVRVAFWDFLPAFGTYRLGRIAIWAYTAYALTDREIISVVDHELSHHVQHECNKHSRMWRGLFHPFQFTAFKEGFAFFASSITNGMLATQHAVALEKFWRGGKPKPAVKPYLVGYMRYLAIAKAFGVDESIRTGLGESVGGWMEKAKTACSTLGVQFV